MKIQVWRFSLSHFEVSSLKFLTFAVSSLKTQVSSFKFEVSHFRSLKFEDSSFKFEVWRLKFQVWSFSLSQFQVWSFHFRFLSLSRRRPSLRVAGQATDISPLAVAFIFADGARAKTIANHSSRFGFWLGFFRLQSVSQSAVATSIDTNFQRATSD